MTTVLATLASTASLDRVATRDARRLAILDDLRLECDRIASDWLSEHSLTVSLPPETASPRVAIASQELPLAGETVAVNLAAFDQHGMVPLGDAPLGLRGTLPARIAQLRATWTTERTSGPTGLDQLASIAPVDLAVFPRVSIQDSLLAAGELLATHAGTERTSINLATAPLRIVEAAMRDAGRGGIEVVIDARSRGDRVPLGSLTRLDGNRVEGPLELLAASPCWAICTDLRIGPLRRAWWTVWLREGSTWRIVQRLEVAQ
ncbi:MAG: hypothetical protein AAFX79_00030 [Planctomycetota bacterium]